MKYFHECSDEEINRDVLDWKNMHKEYMRPKWCGDDRALLPMPSFALGGCIKLINRKVINSDSCRNCRSFKNTSGE